MSDKEKNEVIQNVSKMLSATRIEDTDRILSIATELIDLVNKNKKK